MSASDIGVSRYTKIAIALHWTIALVLVVQFTLGWWMQSIPKQPVGPRVDAYNLHKSIGLVILALMMFRLGWRLSHPPPPLPAMAVWQRRLATFTHALLYVALIAMPLAGYLGSVFSGYPVKFFGTTLPAWGVANAWLKDLMSSIHYATSWVIAGATLLHVAGALLHALAADGLLARMGIGAPAARRS